MKKALIIPAVIVVSLVGCRQQENANQLKAINECLQKTNAVIQYDNKLYYEAIKAKVKDPLTSRDGMVWEPRASMVKKHIDSITLLIENLKGELLKQSDSLRKANAPIVEQLYEINGIGYVLMNKLAAFKDSIPGIFRITDFSNEPYLVTNLKQDLGRILDTISLLPGYRGSLSVKQRSIYKKKWVEENFAGSNSLMAMIQLNKIKCEVLEAEMTLVGYCLDRIPAGFCGYARQPHPFAIINSSYVKSGQTVEITAGITQIVASCQPRITINGKEIKVNSEDVAEYSFKATGKPGKHIIPVKLDFYRPDSTRLRMTKNIEYIIAEK